MSHDDVLFGYRLRLFTLAAEIGVRPACLQGIDNAEIIAAVHARRAPMIPASAGLRLQSEPR
jgi:hypothetical protein